MEIYQWIDPQGINCFVKAPENHPIEGIDWGLILRNSGTADMIPTPAIVQKLKECRDRLINPPGVIPTFQRKVETLLIQNPLARVLKIIRQRDYSQFPAYEGERFRGLLTENGITRWLAHHVDTKFSSVELEDVSVKEVLQNEERLKTYHFVPADSRVDDVSGLFALHGELEAVLITTEGKESEPLLGIATRWDILHLK